MFVAFEGLCVDFQREYIFLWNQVAYYFSILMPKTESRVNYRMTTGYVYRIILKAITLYSKIPVSDASINDTL